jgi:predicted phosphodiesterase
MRRTLTAVVVVALFGPPLSAHLRRDPAVPPAYAGGPTENAGRVVIYGDTRPEALVWPFSDFDPAAHRRVVEAIAAERPDAVIHTGDFVLFGAQADEWAQFDRAAEPLRAVPFYPILGNHEYLGRHDTALGHFFARFPHLKGERWYPLRVRDVVLLLMDSNVKHLGAARWDAQQRWLQDQVRQVDADPSVRLLFLVCHHPPYTHSVHSPSREVLEAWDPVARRSPKYRALFAGHVHSVERYEVGGVHYINSGGGGAPLVGVGGDDLYAPGRRRRGYNYCVLTFGAEGVRVVVKEFRDGAWTDGATVEIR